MPGKEIKGKSKRVRYSSGSKPIGGQAKLDVAEPKGVLNEKDFKALGERSKFMGGGMAYAGGGKAMPRVKRAGGGGLYANIHAKKARIAAGSGEKMRKPGSPGAPTAANFKRAAKTAKA